MPDCSFSSRLDAYYDGELEPQAAELVEQHLSECAECRAELESLHHLSERFEAAATQPLSRASLRELYQTPRQSPERALLPFAVGLMATAASILIVAAAWLSEIPQPAASSNPTVAVRELAPWEQFAMNGQVVLPSGMDDEPAVAQVNLARWMVYDLSRGSER